MNPTNMKQRGRLHKKVMTQPPPEFEPVAAIIQTIVTSVISASTAQKAIGTQGRIDNRLASENIFVTPHKTAEP